MRLISVCFISFLVFFLIHFNSFATTEDETLKVTGGQIDKALLGIVPVRFLPNHPLYFLITAKENFSRILKPSAAKKAEFDFILSGKRLKETHMLIAANNFNKASKNLERYNKRLQITVEQIEKARSQNQDIANLIGVISDSFLNHEILLISFLEHEDRLGQKLEESIGSFGKAVVAVDKLNPGVMDRFKILKSLKSDEDKESTSIPKVEGESTSIIEATPQVRTRRIIY